MPLPSDPAGLIVVIGDVHEEIGLAAEALAGLEAAFARPVAQVFSVGDFGLFRAREDWRWQTGPKRFHQPERSAEIAAAWDRWRWPLSMVGGNHEPWGRLRGTCFDPDYFGGKLRYRDAGQLDHDLPIPLRVYGLSGIFHPKFLGAGPAGETAAPPTRAPEEELPLGLGPATAPEDDWGRAVRLVAAGQLNPKRLTYYKQAELDRLRSLPPGPHLLLLHDWPELPADLVAARGGTPGPPRPEAALVRDLGPRYVACGHHHRSARSSLAGAEVLALNILRAPDAAAGTAGVAPGWAAVFAWDPAAARPELRGLWP